MYLPVERIPEPLRIRRDSGNSGRERRREQPEQRNRRHDTVTISDEARLLLNAGAACHEEGAAIL